MLDNLPTLLATLFLQGEEIVIPGNTHFPLNDPDAVYWVQDEGGDIFLYAPQDPDFIPVFLFAADPFSLMVSSPNHSVKSDYAFFFVSSKQAKLRKISFAKILEEAKKSPEATTLIAYYFEEWLTHLYDTLPAVKKDVKIAHYFKIGDQVAAKEKEALALAKVLTPEEKHKIAWLSVEEGSGVLQDDPTYTFQASADRLYPFFHALFIRAKTPFKVKSSSSETALFDPSFWSSIAEFHRLIFAATISQKSKELEDALVKMQRRRTMEQQLYKETFYKLGSVLNKNIVVPTTFEGTPLFKACDLIGQRLGIKMRVPPPSTTPMDIPDQVREICLTNGIYYRKVTLVGDWWREADQPILGFFGSDKTPVALLKKTRKTYDLIDPVSQAAPISISKKSPDGLSETAYVFYEGFPKKSLTFIDFIKTAFKWNLQEFFTILGVGCAGGLVNLFMPFAMKELFDTLSHGKDVSLLMQFTLGLLIVAFTTGIFSVTKNFALSRVEGLSKNQTASSLWARTLELPASFFRQDSSGNLMNKIETFQHIRSSVASCVFKLVVDISYSFFYIAMMFLYSVIFTAVGLGAMAIATFIYLGCIIIQVKLTTKSFQLGNTIQGLVVQMITGLAKIRVAGAESRFFSMWGSLFSEKKKVDIKIQYTNAIQSLVFRLFPVLMTAALYAVAISLFSDSQANSQTPFEKSSLPISLGTFLGFTTAFGLFTTSALGILETCYTLCVIMPYWKNIKYVIEHPLERQIERVQTTKLQGGVAVDHIYFRYAKDGNWILHDVSIVAHPGEMIAIVGPSGCGKSTIVRMLLGFENPDQGEVLFDDNSLKDLDLRNVRKQIGVVLQNAGILAGSLYENIVGAGTYKVEDIEKALRLSGFQADLENLPMGLNTILSMGGNTLSGGQRQRLYLARALVSSPKILILDEATSALDNKTQEFVSANLDAIDVTRIVIAHRLSTIKNADRIYVMEAGHVKEVGTFQELVDKNGLFAEMYRRQQL